MIKSFRNRGLKLFWEEANARRLPVKNAERVQAILSALDAAAQASDMNLPGMVWHPLKQYSPLRYAVRVSGNYRITYAWDQGAVDVDLEDYH